MTTDLWREIFINEQRKKQPSSYSERFLAKREHPKAEVPSSPGTKPSIRSFEERYRKTDRHPLSNNAHKTEKKTDKAQYLPRLSKKAEKQLAGNFKELSMVSGNILGLKRDAKTIYISSCFDAEGKTTSAINTAYALSTYEGRNVLLIDGNLHSPQIHRLFNTDVSPGLSDFLYSNISLKEVLLPTQYNNLTIMPAGSMSSDKAVPFNEDVLKTKLDQIRSQFDYVIFDGNSVFGSSEAVSLANHFDAVILVVECEKTKWEVLQMANEKIQKAGGAVLGVVLNKRIYYMPETIYRIMSKR